MRCLIYCSLVILMIAGTAPAATGDRMSWYTRVDNLNSHWDEAWHIHQLSGGNGYVLTGLSVSPNNGTSGKHAFFMKLDAGGNWVNTVFYGDTDPLHDFQGYELHPIDAAGAGQEYIFVGRTNKNGYHQVLFMKLDSDFSPIWTRLYGTAELQMGGFSVQPIGSGGVDGFIIAGFARHYVDGISNSDQTDGLLIRTDVQGVADPSQGIGFIKTFDVDGNNDVFKSVRNLGGTAFVASGYTRVNGQYDILLVKTDAAGDELFTKMYGGADLGQFGEGMKQTGDALIVTGGSFIEYSESAPLMRGHIWKTDYSGQTTWFQTFGRTGSNATTYGQSVIELLNGDYVAAGFSSQDLYKDVRSAVAKIGSDGTVKYDREILGGSKTEYIYWVQPTGDDGYVVCGVTYNGVTPADNPDVFAAKFTPAVCGDANGDGLVTVADIVFISAYLNGGPPPADFELANADGDCPKDDVDEDDIYYLQAYIFQGGPAPKCPWCIE